MAGSLNKVMLIGRLGRDPELRYTQGGSPVANFSMATDESYSDNQGNKQERTEWHRIVVFGKQAETISHYLGKGSLVYVEGRLQTRKWQDNQGQDRYMTEVVAQRVQFLETKGQGATQAPQAGGAQKGAQPAEQPAPDEEDYGPAFPSEASGMDEVPF